MSRPGIIIIISAILGCIALCSCSDTKRKIQAEEAISSIHHLLNSHAIERAYRGEVEHLRIWIDQDRMRLLSARIQQEYGTIVSSRTTYHTQRDTEHGLLVTINKRTEFSKKVGTEIFEIVIDDDDAILMAYGVMNELK